ncbi:MAG: hypothetical protein L6R42_008640 [Xanthoria sp. 1 TBL-2021]|nr:MAG: hypothetical protein L6R42_008640 [Xanthoria sp. 1 TBL-2021]
MADFYVASWLEQLDSLSASEISLPGSFPKNPPSEDSVIEDFVYEDSIAEESLTRFERCIRLEHVHGRPSYPLAREIMEKVESPWIGHRTWELCVPLKFTGKVLASIVREVYDLVKYKDVFFAGKSMKIDEPTPTIEEQERSYIDTAGRIMFHSQKIGLSRGFDMILEPESTSPSRQLKPAPLTFQALDEFLEMKRKMLMGSNVETQRAESFYGEHEDGAYGEAEDEGQDEEEEVVLDDHQFLNYADCRPDDFHLLAENFLDAAWFLRSIAAFYAHEPDNIVGATACAQASFFLDDLMLDGHFERFILEGRGKQTALMPSDVRFREPLEEVLQSESQDKVDQQPKVRLPECPRFAVENLDGRHRGAESSDQGLGSEVRLQNHQQSRPSIPAKRPQDSMKDMHEHSEIRKKSKCQHTQTPQGAMSVDPTENSPSPQVDPLVLNYDENLEGHAGDFVDDEDLQD